MEPKKRGRSGEWFERVLDSAEHFVLIKGKNSKLLWANRAFRDYYGMSAEDLEGIVDGPQSSPDHTLQYVRDDHEVFTSGKVLHIPAEPVTDHAGQTRMFNTTKTAYRDRDRDRAVLGVLCVSHIVPTLDDVATEYAKRHNEDAAYTRQIRGFVSTLPQPCVLLDRQLRIVATSEGWRDTFQGSSDVDSLSLFSEVYGDRLQLTKAVDEASRGTSARIQAQEVAVKGESMYFNFTARPWSFFSGSVGGVVVTAEDVTSLQRSQLELRRSNSDLEKFAYVASHDLKSPLHGVAQLVRFIEEDMGDELDAEVAENFGLLKNRVIRMQRLLDDLLRYSRSGRPEPRTLVPLDDIVEEVTDNLVLEKATLTREVPNKDVFVPRIGLVQILQNLVENALRHGGKGVNIELKGFDTPSELRFEVTDDGPGISEQYHQSVFEMFRTLQSRDAREGSGIGLAIVRRIAERHGGSVELVSPVQAGRGARFVLTLPRVTSSESV